MGTDVMGDLPDGFGQVTVSTPGRSRVDEVTGYQDLSRDKEYAAWFRALDEERKLLDADTRKSCSYGDSIGMSRGGGFQLVAKIPPNVFLALCSIYGAEWVYHGGLREWLKRHPEFRLGTTTSRLKT